ncbi:MAG TPA: hypothetical protein VMY59_02995 [Candidatus Thermoplasmatota archaeon]|nr:hypothetical protein [Candidatus Thermoplasmatota archaeon]
MNFSIKPYTYVVQMEKQAKKTNILSYASEKAQAILPTVFGDFTIHIYGGDDGVDHIALVHGDVNKKENVSSPYSFLMSHW